MADASRAAAPSARAQIFNKYDLYSKSDAMPDVQGLKPYYQSLLDKYGIGGKCRF